MVEQCALPKWNHFILRYSALWPKGIGHEKDTVYMWNLPLHFILKTTTHRPNICNFFHTEFFVFFFEKLCVFVDVA